tara:strand:- start:2558 stop:3727 length:1170 start_codon:yes stop_codon:yes gene_type:complete
MAETRTSSSPFIDSILNELAMDSWRKAGGDLRLSIQLYYAGIDQLASRSVSSGIQQEGQESQKKAYQGARSADASSRAEGFKDSLYMKEQSHALKLSMTERAAQLNSLGALVATGVKVAQTYKNKAAENKAFERDWHIKGGLDGTGMTLDEFIEGRPAIGDVQEEAVLISEAALNPGLEEGPLALESKYLGKGAPPPKGFDYRPGPGVTSQGFLELRDPSSPDLEMSSFATDKSITPEIMDPGFGPKASNIQPSPGTVENGGFADQQSDKINANMNEIKEGTLPSMVPQRMSGEQMYQRESVDKKANSEAQSSAAAQASQDLGSEGTLLQALYSNFGEDDVNLIFEDYLSGKGHGRPLDPGQLSMDPNLTFNNPGEYSLKGYGTPIGAE